MRLKVFLISAAVVFALAAYAHAGKIEISIPDPPPVPEFFKKMPEPPPPPPWLLETRDRTEHWFYDAKKKSWFYYDKGRKAHYDNTHKFREDGKHFKAKGGKWVKARQRDAGKLGRKTGNSKKPGGKWWRFWD